VSIKKASRKAVYEEPLPIEKNSIKELTGEIWQAYDDFFVP
jgi:hypothetical protein